MRRASRIHHLSAAAGMLLAGLVAVAATAAQQKPAGQAPAVTFRTAVNAVEVDAVVLDSQGRFVPDLKEEEFEILEDGRLQKLTAMRVVNIPIERVEKPLFASSPIAPEVWTNTRAFDGRLYLIVLDDLQISMPRSNVAKRIAREFIEQNMASNDMAAVVVTSGNRRMSQEFTSSRGLLLRTIDKFFGQKVMSPALSDLSMNGTPEAEGPGAAAAQRLHNAQTSLLTVEALASLAGTIRNRRKAMVLISEGIDYDFGKLPAMPATSTETGDPVVGFIDQGSAPREMRDRLKNFIDTANRANVTLYAFDPRVYTHGGDDMVDIASTPPGDMEAGQEKVKTFDMLDDLQASQDNLRVMAAETGGFAVTGSPKAVENAFDRVRIENSNYYILAYSSTNEARDGKFRRIEVRVRRPGIRVEARRGYVAPKGNAVSTGPLPETRQGTSPAVREALLSTLPVPGFALRATAVPFKGSGRNASVAVIVQTDGRDLQFAERDGRFEDSVELAVVAVDGQGKTRGGERLAVDMPLNDQLRAFVAQAGVVFALRVPLPPGLYDLRVAGRDAGSGRVGAVRFNLEVPDFTQAPLSMSGVVLTADRAGQVPNPRPDEDLGKVLPASPIATRTFATADQLTLFVEVYDNQTADHAVQFQTTVQGEDGRVRFKQDERRSTAELHGKSGGFGYLASVPLADLGPGSYVLRVEARSSLDADTVASRELQFTVR